MVSLARECTLERPRRYYLDERLEVFDVEVLGVEYLLNDLEALELGGDLGVHRRGLAVNPHECALHPSVPVCVRWCVSQTRLNASIECAGRGKKKKKRESKTHSVSPTTGSVVDTEEARTSCTGHEDRRRCHTNHQKKDEEEGAAVRGRV
jgi:hypothetical protein